MKWAARSFCAGTRTGAWSSRRLRPAAPTSPGSSTSAPRCRTQVSLVRRPSSVQESRRLGSMIEDGLMFVDPEQAADVFYGDCDPEVQQAAIARLRTMSLAPHGQPVPRAAWRSLPSTYVVCTSRPRNPHRCATRRRSRRRPTRSSSSRRVTRRSCPSRSPLPTCWLRAPDTTVREGRNRAAGTRRNEQVFVRSAWLDCLRWPPVRSSLSALASTISRTSPSVCRGTP